MNDLITTLRGRATHAVELHPSRHQTVLLVHGFGGSHRGLLPLAKQLTNYRVVAVDLPGHGLTESIPGKDSVWKLARWLNDYIAAMPIVPSVVFGHSYGSLLATVGSVENPQLYPMLIACNPINYNQSRRTRILRAVYWLSTYLPEPIAHRVAYSRTIGDMVGDQMFTTRDQELKERLKKIGYEDKLKVPYRTGIDLVRSAQKLNTLKYFRDISVPTLAITGTADQLIDASGMTELHSNPSVSLESVEGAGHLLPLESPEIAARIMNDWFHHTGHRKE